MKEYVGIKSIKAHLMNLGDYNNYRGWEIPKDEDPAKEGYLVEYEDSYQSWSPKKAFEDAYVISNSNNFIYRVNQFTNEKGWIDIKCYDNSDCKCESEDVELDDRQIIE